MYVIMRQAGDHWQPYSRDYSTLEEARHGLNVLRSSVPWHRFCIYEMRKVA